MSINTIIRWINIFKVFFGINEEQAKIIEGIRLQTKLGNDIKNSQITNELPLQELHQAREHKNDFPRIDIRNEPCGYYNCHGLTFASRRTRIWENAEISKILTEDNYYTINRDDVLPGDVIIYAQMRNGSIKFIHSGIIIESYTLLTEKSIKVLSKWGNGPEIIHDEKDCSYWSDCEIKKYYRMHSVIYRNKNYGM